jgi:hypothetical protein
MSSPCAPGDGSGQCCTSPRSGSRATRTIDGSRIARNIRSPAASGTHQRGRPGRGIAHRRCAARSITWSSGPRASSPMQAATARRDRARIATPLGRGAVSNRAFSLSVVASNHTNSADPRLVTRTCPASATTPAASEKPFRLATWRRVCESITSRPLRAVCATKTRRWLKGAVVKRAVGSAGYFNYARKLQRHRSSPRRDAFLPQLTMSQASRL